MQSDPVTCGEIRKILKGCDTEHGNRCWEPGPGAETTALIWAHKVIIKWVEKKKLSKSRTDSEQKPLSNPCEMLIGEDRLKSFPFKVTKLEGWDIQNCKIAIHIVQQLLCCRLQLSDWHSYFVYCRHLNHPNTLHHLFCQMSASWREEARIQLFSYPHDYAMHQYRVSTD